MFGLKMLLALSLTLAGSPTLLASSGSGGDKPAKHDADGTGTGTGTGKKKMKGKKNLTHMKKHASKSKKRDNDTIHDEEMVQGKDEIGSPKTKNPFEPAKRNTHDSSMFPVDNH
ncbi:MAG: hypothetical protein H7249_06000 [Chitinophagaceae bacterium]|nr:hypothetical protein [Oligoflexus sp.]